MNNHIPIRHLTGSSSFTMSKMQVDHLPQTHSSQSPHLSKPWLHPSNCSSQKLWSDPCLSSIVYHRVHQLYLQNVSGAQPPPLLLPWTKPLPFLCSDHCNLPLCWSPCFYPPLTEGVSCGSQSALIPPMLRTLHRQTLYLSPSKSQWPYTVSITVLGRECKYPVNAAMQHAPHRDAQGLSLGFR